MLICFTFLFIYIFFFVFIGLQKTRVQVHFNLLFSLMTRMKIKKQDHSRYRENKTILDIEKTRPF